MKKSELRRIIKEELKKIEEAKEYRYVLSVEFITDRKISNSAEDLLNGSYFYEEDFPGAIKNTKLIKHF